MRVDELIKLLQDWERHHGSGAQISVPRDSYEREVAVKQGIKDPQDGEEIYIRNLDIATILTSRGPEVEY